MFSLLLASFISAGVFAADLPTEIDVPVIEGKFTYHHNYSVLRTTESISVPLDDPDSESMINKLLGEGYRCTPKEDEFLCWKESTLDPNDVDEVKDLVAERCKAESLSFRAQYDPTELVHSSDFLRTFRVFQKVVRTSPDLDEEEVVSAITYSWNTTGRWWVTFPSQQGAFTYDLEGNNRLTRFLTVEKETGSNKFKGKRSYQVQVFFERE